MYIPSDLADMILFGGDEISVEAPVASTKMKFRSGRHTASIGFGDVYVRLSRALRWDCGKSVDTATVKREDLARILGVNLRDKTLRLTFNYEYGFVTVLDECEDGWEICQLEPGAEYPVDESEFVANLAEALLLATNFGDVESVRIEGLSSAAGALDSEATVAAVTADGT